MENSKRKRRLKQHEIQKIVEDEYIKTQMQREGDWAMQRP